ncbi:MAG: NAD-dependent epimerase/dehydratase family protein [Acidimicrobiales bacterium]
MTAVVVTGAGGAVGRRVVQLLASRDDVERVVAVDTRPLGPLPDGVEALTLDLGEARTAPADPAPDRLEAALAGAACVIHLAWRIDPTREGENIATLTHVLSAADRRGVPGLVHLSSATVYGAWADNPVPLGEGAALRPNPGFAYGMEKAEAERLVAEWAEGHPEVGVVVLRPAVTVGERVHPLYTALGTTRVTGSGESTRRVQFLHVDDLASAVVVAWAEGLRGVYNVAPDGGVGELTARTLASRLTTNIPPRVSAAGEAISWNLWRRGIPPEVRPYCRHAWVVAPDRLRAAGWEPGYTSEEALVVSDTRHHWDDLPPAIRQNANLAVLVVGTAGALFALASAAQRVRRVRRRRRVGR